MSEASVPTPGSGRTAVPDRATLRADCSACVAVCCVVPTFAASSDFAITKPGGRPCPHLAGDHRCSIHADLRRRGFPGCTVYDCFGAGQRISREVLAGRDWRSDPTAVPVMVAVFPPLRLLHELLWYLAEAADRVAAGPLREQVHRMRAETTALAGQAPDAVARLDVEGHRERVGDLLLRVSAAVRTSPGADLRRADLAGADLRRADLAGADLRGSCLIGADLTGADLRCADLLGADVRGADLRGADLRDALFLTQPQLNAARGGPDTRLSGVLTPPAHW